MKKQELMSAILLLGCRGSRRELPGDGVFPDVNRTAGFTTGGSWRPLATDANREAATCGHV